MGCGTRCGGGDGGRSGAGRRNVYRSSGTATGGAPQAVGYGRVDPLTDGTWGAAALACSQGMADDLPPRTQPAPDWDAIARYHAGESPADEARLVAGWLAANASDAAMLATLDDAVDRAVGADVPVAVAEPDVEAALRAVKARRDAELASTIGAAPTAPPKPERPPSYAVSPRVWGSGAAK